MTKQQICGVGPVAPLSVSCTSSPAHTSAGSSSSRAAGGRDGMSARRLRASTALARQKLRAACVTNRTQRRWHGRSCARGEVRIARRGAPPALIRRRAADGMHADARLLFAFQNACNPPPALPDQRNLGSRQAHCRAKLRSDGQGACGIRKCCSLRVYTVAV